MTLRNIRFQIIPLEHGKVGSKLERIKMLQPRFKSHSVWFPDQAEWLTEMKAELAGVTNYEIKSEFIDCVDALAMHEQMNRYPKIVTVSDANNNANSMPRKGIR
jgi:phage terminase large subunit-like protein